MDHIEVLLVGGPSDGRRIRVAEFVDRIQIPDPMPARMWDPYPSPDVEFRFPTSVYVLTSLRFDDFPVSVYAYVGLELPDVWHRLVHRYPNPENEHPSRTYTRNTTVGI